MFIRRIRIFRFISLARTNVSTHSKQSRNGGITRNVNIEMFTAALASKCSFRSTSLRMNPIIIIICWRITKALEQLFFYKRFTSKSVDISYALL